MKGYFEDLVVIAKVLEYQGNEIVWKHRASDVFAAMPNFWKVGVVDQGAEDYAEDVLAEVADRWNTSGKVGQRPRWYRVNKKSLNSNRYYIRFDQSMLLDDAIAEALELDVAVVRLIAHRDYVQFSESKNHTLKRKQRQRRRKKEKIKLSKEQRLAEQEAKKAAYLELRAKAETIAKEVVYKYYEKGMDDDERRQVKQYAVSSARSILSVGQIPVEQIAGIILDSLHRSVDENSVILKIKVDDA